MEIVETFVALPGCIGRGVDFQSSEQLRQIRQYSSTARS
jgi:hypothetical protein